MITTRLARVAAFALALALTTLVSPAVSAQQQNRGQTKKYIATREITVDSQTGALRRPTPVETQELVDSLTSMTNRSSEGLQQTRLSNDEIAVNLQSRFQSVMLARPNPDGSSEVRCVTTFEEAADFLGLVADPSQQ